jgi:hypothetical protein
MPKISVPKDIQTLINTLKLVYEDYKEDSVIKEEKDLEGLDKKKGKLDRQNNLVEYSVNASRILDFLVFKQSDNIIATLKKYDNTLIDAGKAALAVYTMMGKHVDAAIDYLDENNGIPTISSDVLYKKVLYLRWFLAKVVMWSKTENGEKSNFFMNTITTMIHEKVESKITPMINRLEAYERQHQLPLSTLETIQEQIKRIAQEKADAKRAASQAPNSQRMFTPDSSSPASTATESKFEGLRPGG